MKESLPNCRGTAAVLAQRLSSAEDLLATDGDMPHCLRSALELIYMLHTWPGSASEKSESWVDSLLRDIETEALHEMPLGTDLFPDDLLLSEYLAFHIREAQDDIAQVLSDEDLEDCPGTNSDYIVVQHISSHILAAYCAVVRWGHINFNRPLNELLLESPPPSGNAFDLPNLAESLRSH